MLNLIGHKFTTGRISYIKQYTHTVLKSKNSSGGVAVLLL